MVDLDKYRKATSYIRSVQLLGYTVGSVLGQLLFSFKFLSYNDTMNLTLVLIAIALFISFLLPMPHQSMFFHRKTKETDRVFPVNTEHIAQTEEIEDAGEKTADKTEDAQDLAVTHKCGNVLLQIIQDFQECFASRQLLYWSLWWVMATCGFNQTINFVQVSYMYDIFQNKDLWIYSIYTRS